MRLASIPELTRVVIFCKTYAGDLYRAKRLLRSIKNFNRDKIQVFLSVPAHDFNLFSKEGLVTEADAELITDESIIECGSSAGFSHYSLWRGQLSQQVIKSEFWRYWLAHHKNYSEIIYVCIDSESEFIRDFFISDFVHPSGNPYTILHDHEDLMAIAREKKIRKIEANFRNDCAILKGVFSRVGPDFAFSPTPVIWSSKVWADLDHLYLRPRKINLWDAIAERPNELHWYGESVLYFQSIELIPKPPLFRVYHYDWEFYYRARKGETLETIKKNFLGIHKQSNWDHESNNPSCLNKKSIFSNFRRKIRRLYFTYFF